MAETPNPDGQDTAGDNAGGAGGGDGTRMVPESQLMAVKAARTKEHKEAKEQYDALYGKHLELEGRISGLEEKANKVPTLETELTETQGRLYVSEVARGEHASKTLEGRKTNLRQLYPQVSEEDVKDLDEGGVGSLEKALKLVAKPKSDSFATTPGGVGGQTPTSPLEVNLQTLAEYRKRHNMPTRGQ